MATDPKLERYLDVLDRSLGSISTSDRADIVTEIKSHVLEAMSREPSRDLSDILASLGEPEAVANKYLLERGLKPGKPSKSPIVKWLTIGFLGTFGISVLAVVLIIWKFTPIISISEKDEKVSILGGMIDIDGSAGKIKIGSTTVESSEDGPKHLLRGSKALSLAKDFLFEFPFSNGKVEVEPSVDSTLRWDCKFTGDEHSMSVSEGKNNLKLLADKARGVECDVQVPNGVQVKVNGNAGEVKIKKPSAATTVGVKVGSVSIEPNQKTNYRYELKVGIGKVDEAFAESKGGADALLVKVDVGTGQIEME